MQCTSTNLIGYLNKCSGRTLPCESSQQARALAPGCAVRRAITAAAVTGDPINDARDLRTRNHDGPHPTGQITAVALRGSARGVGAECPHCLPRGRERRGGGGEGGRDAAARGRERGRGAEARGRGGWRGGRAARGREDGPGGVAAPRHG